MPLNHLAFSRIASVLVFGSAILAAGCGVSEVTQGCDVRDGGGDAADDDVRDVPASCVLLASSYDQSCEQDSDCVLVPPGGNICDPCSAGSGCLFCQAAAVNARAVAQYRAALATALSRFETSPELALNSCVVGSCPTESTPQCVRGTCTQSWAPACGP